MKNWTYYNPVKVIAGNSLYKALPALVEPGEWLLITSAGFTKRGVTETLQQQLPESHLHIHDTITSNPELDDLEAITQSHKNLKLKGIIALGGGSVVDAAKVLAVTLPSEHSLPLTYSLRQGHKIEWNNKLPLIAIPTTSGTGAEITPFATVWDATTHKKYSVVGEHIYPDIALYDPELTVSLPHKETLYTGLDAISHALESLWNVNRTPISESFAVQALSLAKWALPNALTEPTKLKTREAMQQASMLAGLAISQTRTAIAHSISYPLTSHFDVPHGLACSFTLPNIIDFYLKHKPDESHKELMQDVKSMLEQLELAKHIHSYASDDDIKSLHQHMFHVDRAANFSVPMVSNDLFQFIK